MSSSSARTGRPLPDAPGAPRLPDGPAESLRRARAEQGLEIDGSTVPLWSGDPLDLDLAMRALRRGGGA